MQLGQSFESVSAGDGSRIFVLTGSFGALQPKGGAAVGRAPSPVPASAAKLQVLAGTAAIRLARARAISGGLVVALGSETAAILLSRMVSMPLERGKVGRRPGGRVLVAEHPATILQKRPHRPRP